MGLKKTGFIRLLDFFEGDEEKGLCDLICAERCELLILSGERQKA